MTDNNMESSVSAYVAEWIDGVTLTDYLKTGSSRKELRRIALELAEAMSTYPHQVASVGLRGGKVIACLKLLT